MVRDVRDVFVGVNIGLMVQRDNAIRPVQSTLCPVDTGVHPTAFGDCQLRHSIGSRMMRRVMRGVSCEAIVMKGVRHCVHALRRSSRSRGGNGHRALRVDAHSMDARCTCETIAVIAGGCA
jgi:hypothetical protein